MHCDHIHYEQVHCIYILLFTDDIYCNAKGEWDVGQVGCVNISDNNNKSSRAWPPGQGFNILSILYLQIKRSADKVRFADR